MFSGNMIGSKDKEGFIRQMRDCTLVAGGTAFLLGAGIIVFAPWAVQLLTREPAVQKIAEGHAYYAGIYIMFSFVAFQLDGIFIGATRSKEMRNASILSLFILIVAGTILTSCCGNTGMWITFLVSSA